MGGFVVDARVQIRHPGINDDDVLTARRNAFNVVIRDTSEKDFHVAVGADMKGRLLELVAAEDADGTMRIFHANTPPSERTLKELGIIKQ